MFLKQRKSMINIIFAYAGAMCIFLPYFLRISPLFDQLLNTFGIIFLIAFVVGIYFNKTEDRLLSLKQSIDDSSKFYEISKKTGVIDINTLSHKSFDSISKNILPTHSLGIAINHKHLNRNFVSFIEYIVKPLPRYYFKIRIVVTGFDIKHTENTTQYQEVAYSLKWLSEFLNNEFEGKDKENISLNICKDTLSQTIIISDSYATLFLLTDSEKINPVTLAIDQKSQLFQSYKENFEAIWGNSSKYEITDGDAS